MGVAIAAVIVNIQEALAPAMLTFSSFMSSDHFLKNNASLGSSAT
jgi:hypothetical protein